MSKNDAINIMNNSSLIDKMGKMAVFKIFLLYIKMCDMTYYQRNRDVILNGVKGYYENNRLRKIERSSKR